MSEPAPDLDAFFAAMTPYLSGEGALSQVFARLGPSPSDETRFSFYRHLCTYNPRRIIEKVYRGTRAFAEAAGVDFRALAEAHLAARRPFGWDIPRVAFGFSEAVSGACDADPALPRALEELADFEELRHRILVFGRVHDDDTDTGALDPSVEVRTYTFDVKRYVNAARRGERPEKTGGERTLILHAHKTTRRFVTHAPDGPQLFALAIAAGEADAAAASDAGLSAEVLAAARAQLVDKGILR